MPGKVNQMEKLQKCMAESNIRDYGIMEFSKIPQLINCRATSRLPSNPKSVIMVVLPYYVGEFNKHNLCKYAALVDYHTLALSILSKACNILSYEYNADFVPFVDNSPIPEVSCATQAGLGFRGKHNLLITPKYGSYVMLCEIVTNYEFPPSQPCNGSCLGCNLCVYACLNHAISSSGIDYTRCVSKISQQKSQLCEEARLAISQTGLAWGCDQCQDCCPHNKSPEKTYIEAFLNDIEPTLTPDNIDDLLQTRSFGYKGKALLERNLSIINAKKSSL